MNLDQHSATRSPAAQMHLVAGRATTALAITLLAAATLVTALGAQPIPFIGQAPVSAQGGVVGAAVAIHPIDPSVVIAGTHGPGPGLHLHYSVDGGATWSQSAALPLGGTCCDPGVAWSADGRFAYATALGSCTFSGCEIWLYRSGDGGRTWTDLETLTPGDPRRELGAGAGGGLACHGDENDPDALYLSWSEAGVVHFARSADSGGTWSTTGFQGEERGHEPQIVTDESGNLFLFWSAFESGRVVMKRSTDRGASFQPGLIEVASVSADLHFSLPAIDQRGVTDYVSAAADLGLVNGVDAGGPHTGSLYVAWTDSTGPTSAVPEDNHGRIQVASSRDLGATWTVVTPHATIDQSTVDRFQPSLAVDGEGRVHVVFYDSRRDPTRGSVDLFHAVSYDGGVTFSSPGRLNDQPSPPVFDGWQLGDSTALDLSRDSGIALFTTNRPQGGEGDDVWVYAAGFRSPLFADGFESGGLGSWSSLAQ